MEFLRGQRGSVNLKRASTNMKRRYTVVQQERYMEVMNMVGKGNSKQVL